jgi:hypothetical protein
MRCTRRFLTIAITVVIASALAGCSSGTEPSPQPTPTGTRIQGTIKVYNGLRMTDTLQLKHGDPCSPVATELAEELLIKDGAGKILAKGTITSEGTTSLLPQGTDKFETAVYCTVSFAAKGVPNSRIALISQMASLICCGIDRFVAALCDG